MIRGEGGGGVRYCMVRDISGKKAQLRSYKRISTIWVGGIVTPVLRMCANGAAKMNCE